MARKNKTPVDLLDGFKPEPVAVAPKEPAKVEPPEIKGGEAPTLLEYTPPGSTERWRVEKFELLVAEFGLASPYEKGMALLHQAAGEYSRGWLVVRRLFGIGPVIPQAGAAVEDLQAQSREQVMRALGLDKEQLQAEVDAVRAIVGKTLAQVEPAAEAPVEKRETLEFGDDLLREYGFDEGMFKVLTWDPVAKVEVPRIQELNRRERDWFCARLKKWEKMLREPMAETVVREALMNDLYLQRLKDEMGRLSPTTPKFKELRSMRADIEGSYQKQLKELGEMFPEMNIEGKVSFKAVLSDVIKGVRDYKARGDNRLVDKIRTAAEMEVEVRQSSQSPQARYRFGLNVAIVEAMHGLYDPDFRSQFRPSTLKKLDEGMRRGIEEVRQREGEALVDLENGVMPGEGDEFPDIPQIEKTQ